MMKKSQLYKMRGYILSVSILLAVVCGVNIWFYQSFKKQAENVNDYVKEHTIENISNFYEQINLIVSRTINVNDLSHISNIQSIRDVYRSEAIRDLVVKIKETSISMKNVHGIYVYLEQYDLVLSQSGIQPSELFYNSTGKNYADSYKKWHEKFEQKDLIQDFEVRNGNIIYTFFVNGKYEKSADSGKIYIGAFIDEKVAFAKTPYIEWINKCNIYIYDRNEKLSLYNECVKFKTIGDKPTRAQLIKESDEFDTYFYDVSINDTTYSICVVFEKNLDMHKTKQVQFISNAMILGVFLLILFFLYNTVITKLRPLEAISKMIGIDPKRIDYRLIEGSIEKIVDSNDNLKEILKSKDSQLKTLCLIRILNGEINSESIKLMEKCGIRFNYSHFVVFVISINKDTDISEEENNSIVFELRDAVYEATNTKQGEPYFVITDDLFACIYNVEPCIDLEKLGRDFTQLLSAFEKKYDVVVSIAVSNEYEGYEEIPTAYLETMDVIGRNEFFDKSEVVFYHDTENEKSGRGFRIDDERKLLEIIKSGDAETAVSEIKRVTDYVNEKNTVMMRNISIGVVYFLMRTAVNIFGENYNTDNLYKLLKNTDNLELIRKGCIEFTTKLCDDVTEASGTINLAEQIKNYLEKNYLTPQLSAEYLSDAFSFSIIHLNNIFKKTYGMTPLSYLSEYRIKKAKEYIAGGMKIGDAAKESGYSSIRTFNRTFYNSTGMTPTEYKKNITGKEKADK